MVVDVQATKPNFSNACNALEGATSSPRSRRKASEFFVSRTTIRNALKVLELEGKIERNARPMDDRPAAPVGIAIRFIG
jgi:DNA-binding transcriptional MocR family regulator